MTTAQLKNAKINAIVELDIKYRRFSNGLKTPGVDQAAIQKILDRIQNQKAGSRRRSNRPDCDRYS